MLSLFASSVKYATPNNAPICAPVAALQLVAIAMLFRLISGALPQARK